MAWEAWEVPVAGPLLEPQPRGTLALGPWARLLTGLPGLESGAWRQAKGGPGWSEVFVHCHGNSRRLKGARSGPP